MGSVEATLSSPDASHKVKSIRKTVADTVPSWLLARVRVGRLRRSLRQYRRRIVEHSYCGFPLKVLIADGLAEGWYDHDWLELPELDLLSTGRLRPGARVFNIGAHQGVVAAILSRMVGETGQVVAVEPNPHNYEVGLQNRSLNGIPQLEIINAAVAARSGYVVFDQKLNGSVDCGGGEWGTMRVRAVTVDELSRDYGVPDVLFVDVEGYEVCVLDGAQRTLQELPDAYVEVHKGHGLERYGHCVSDVVSFFRSRRYESYVMAPGDQSFVPIAKGASVLENRFCLVSLSRQ